MKITVTENVTRALKSMVSGITNEKLAMEGGLALMKMVKRHFTEMDSTHANKMGGLRTHFWSDMGRKTSRPVPEQPGTVVVSIGDARLPQKVYGGGIHAGKGISWKTGKKTKFLTIPATALAYGKKAESFGNTLKLSVFKNGAGNMVMALVVARKTMTRKWDFRASMGTPNIKNDVTLKREEVVFWLKKFVYQKPEPDALPAGQEMEAAVMAGMKEYVDLQVAKAKGN
jgi:hypothetical protein